jgi:4'-phosphopantetheinyl transferase
MEHLDAAAPPLRWWAGSDVDVPAGTGWMSAAEQARLATMRFTKRRSEYRLRRWVGKRAVLAWHGEVTGAGEEAAPAEAALAGVEVLNRPGGAPHVVVGGEPAAVDISLTDRAGCAVAVLAPAGVHLGGGIGVDIEVVEPRSDGFVADFLTPAEQRWLREGPLGRDVAANLLWSAKESALKVLGVGLMADTRRVDVRVGNRHHDQAGDRHGWLPLEAVVADGWAPVAERVPGATLPGWWRRDGVWLLTVTTRRPVPPPRALARSADLVTLEPRHAWLEGPLVTPAE